MYIVDNTLTDYETYETILWDLHGLEYYRFIVLILSKNYKLVIDKMN